MDGHQHYEEGERLLEVLREHRNWEPGERGYVIDTAHAHFTAAIAAAHLGRDRVAQASPQPLSPTYAAAHPN